jgi:hypothetical protein
VLADEAGRECRARAIDSSRASIKTPADASFW